MPRFDVYDWCEAMYCRCLGGIFGFLSGYFSPFNDFTVWCFLGLIFIIPHLIRLWLRSWDTLPIPSSITFYPLVFLGCIRQLHCCKFSSVSLGKRMGMDETPTFVCKIWVWSFVDMNENWNWRDIELLWLFYFALCREGDSHSWQRETGVSKIYWINSSSITVRNEKY